MLYQESETVELKSVAVDDIRKEIIAFANCSGGMLYIGVRDDGTVVGVEDPDSTALQISNMVRDAIKPDLTMFLHYKTIEEDGKKIVAVEIQRGTDRPYYIAGKGMRPEGVYVRQGYSSVPASDNAIRSMIRETDGDRFETMRSLDQDLTFSAAEQEFRLRNVEFGPQQMRTLGLIDNDGLFTNLAGLLSDQCVHTIKAAVFQGKDQTVFRDRREFTGSLMQQMNEAYDFIDFRNQTQASFKRLSRIDVRDYPETAVREALLILIVHRDYSFSASALISIYEDRIEFISVGGLMPGIELEDVMSGLSVCRNQKLADIFYRLHLIEAYGTGLRKIIKAYDGAGADPVITTTKNSFKIILPNINAVHPEAGVSASQPDDREQQIIDYLKEHGSISRQDVEKMFSTSVSTAARLLKKMVQSSQIRPLGKAKNVRYTAGKC